MDKWGQKWPLRIFVPCYAGMLLALNMAHDRTILLVAAESLTFFSGFQFREIELIPSAVPPINIIAEAVLSAEPG